MADPQALRADRFDLYERAVQDPAVDLRVVAGLFEARAGRPPRDLREDFCGTALLACTWVRGGADRRAWGVDLDAEPLAWGEARNVAALEPEARARVALLKADVLHVGPPRVPAVDVILACNYSFFVFKTRERLRAYLARARAGLKDGGALVLEVMGGPEVQTAACVRTPRDGFTAAWERDFDPISGELRCALTFQFPDGSFLDGFTYDWRLWSIRELRELLAEAGFAASQACWEGPGERGEGDRAFAPRERARAELAWTAYVVGWR